MRLQIFFWTKVTFQSNGLPGHPPPVWPHIPTTDQQDDRRGQSHGQRLSCMEWSRAGGGHHEKASADAERAGSQEPLCMMPSEAKKPQPTLSFHGACNRVRGWREEAAAFINNLARARARQASHPPKRCSRSHCTLVCHVGPRSHDPLRSVSSGRSHTKSLQRWSEAPQLEPNHGGNPDFFTLLRSIPGRWAFALRVPRVAKKARGKKHVLKS